VTDVQPLRVRIRAPRGFAYQCLSTFDRTSPIWLQRLEPDVLRRGGEGLLVRLRQRTMGRVVAGVASVRLFAPDRVDLELLDGTLCALRERLVLETESATTTVLVWSAELELKLPFGSRLLERTVAARLLRADARATLDRYRVTIEAAALATGLVEAAR
jgi:hypothetical protein